jgi:shikimate dehydrogenase
MKTFAVFGDPVAHSVSPRLHNKALRDLGLDALYTRVLLKDGNELINKFRSLKLNGANVTLPHKEFALNLADVASEAARKIGSANTLVLKNEKIYAYNTDAPGFLKAISNFKEAKSAIILGAGGTANALAYALKEQNIDVCILNRSKARLEKFKDRYECFSWDDYKEYKFDLAINSTSAGLKDDLLPAPKEILDSIFKNAKFVFDVIYSKQTPFLKEARTLNLECKDGADMLLYQAILALNLFYNNVLDEKRIEISMREALSL